MGPESVVVFLSLVPPTVYYHNSVSRGTISSPARLASTSKIRVVFQCSSQAEAQIITPRHHDAHASLHLS
jgi:hypothetical protein